MSEVTVKQLAKTVDTPVERLLEQCKEAGLQIDNEDTVIGDADKAQLLNFLRNIHGKKDKDLSSSKKITLKRKTVSELKVSGGGAAAGRPKTVSVEVRKKRTYVKRSDAVNPEQEELNKLIEEKEKRQEDDQVLVEANAAKKADQAATKKAEEEEQARKKAAADAAKEAESKLKEEESRKAEAERLKQEADQKRADSEAKTQTDTRKKAKKGKKASGDIDRQELHVSKDKRGKRKKKMPAKHVAAADSKHGFEMPVAPVVREVEISNTITVAELASRMSIKASEVIKVMMKMGVMATINQVIDQETAVLVTEEMGHTVKTVSEGAREAALLSHGEDSDIEKVLRPPVVTIMGHVDHGKTSLLDYIRESTVTSAEAGGITQHIGAYHVETAKGVITFLDTPGHAAFTSMRARGAQATDIVILVVAADDGVMPQTIEAIQHAKAAKVPLIVAVNKIDKEDADPERVKNELSAHEVIPEDWGGENMFVHVSAKTGDGIQALLEAISLQAELLELTARVEGKAKGTVIEASLDKGRGVIATVLVQEGTLKKGDILLAGQEYGRVRAMFDENARPIEEAGPSIPVVVLGLSGTPQAGDEALVVEDDRKAREVAEMRYHKERDVRLATQQQAKLDSMFDNMGADEIKVLNVLVKADVQGSLEAIRDSLMKLAASNDEIDVTIVGSGVGGITETDVTLAAASNAVVLGFNVRADASARRAVSERDVDLHYYSVIYDLIDQVKASLTGMLDARYEEKIIGLAEVKDVFKSPKFGSIAGSIVTEGTIKRDQPIRVLRENIVIYEGELESLRRFKDDVNEVRSGTECGIGVKNYTDVRPGDQIEVFDRIEVKRTL
ncbi:MAG: translation initiation factor IF-2 [Gammaproteobacteria bacterium]|nr:translation initiation factor IF-2 [Gammaproteobacteria bacterium]